MVLKQTYVLIGALITLVVGALLGSFYSTLPVGQVCAYSAENDIAGWEYSNGHFEAELSRGWYFLGTAVDVSNELPTLNLQNAAKHAITPSDWMIRWNPSDDQYVLNKESGDDELDSAIPVTNFPLLSGQGYWYYVQEDGTYTISGSETRTTVPIKQGWNMITAPGLKEVDIGVVKFHFGEEIVGLHAAVDLRKLFRYVYFYNPEVECASSSYVIIDLKGYGNLKPNIGYWIYAYEDGVLEFPESNQAISVEMNIEAEREEYTVGETVMLKEILPSLPSTPEISPTKNRVSSKLLSDSVSVQTVATKEEPNFDGYIVEFKDQPLTKVVGTASITAARVSIDSVHEQARNDITNLVSGSVSITSTGTKSQQKVIGTEFTKVFNGMSVKVDATTAQKIRKLSYVKRVVPNRRVKTTLMDSVPLINADEVWMMNSPGRTCDGRPENCLRGKGIKVAVIDTGIDYTHPDFGSCTRAQFLAKQCAKVIDGYDFVNEDNDPMDDQGHGTHVAGTIAANGVLKGVAPDASIIAYKVLGADGSGSFEGKILYC